MSILLPRLAPQQRGAEPGAPGVFLRLPLRTLTNQRELSASAAQGISSPDSERQTDGRRSSFFHLVLFLLRSPRRVMERTAQRTFLEGFTGAQQELVASELDVNVVAQQEQDGDAGMGGVADPFGEQHIIDAIAAGGVGADDFGEDSVVAGAALGVRAVRFAHGLDDLLFACRR